MLILNSVKRRVDGVVEYGVLDTQDSVETFYTTEKIYEIANTGVKIQGVTGDSSHWKLVVTTILIEYLNELHEGDKFKLNINGKIVEYIMLGKLRNNKGFKVKNGENIQELTNVALLKKRNEITLCE
jgi:hypothetical protein